MSDTKQSGSKPTPQQFVEAFIGAYKEAHPTFVNSSGVTEPTRGIHTVYAKVAGIGFNEAYRLAAVRYGWSAPMDNPVDATNKLTADGKLLSGRARGGAFILLPSDAVPMERQQSRKTEDVFAALRLV
jgi:hypothetical protein